MLIPASPAATSTLIPRRRRMMRARCPMSAVSSATLLTALTRCRGLPISVTGGVRGCWDPCQQVATVGNIAAASPGAGCAGEGGGWLSHGYGSHSRPERPGSSYAAVKITRPRPATSSTLASHLGKRTLHLQLGWHETKTLVYNIDNALGLSCRVCNLSVSRRIAK